MMIGVCSELTGAMSCLVYLSSSESIYPTSPFSKRCIIGSTILDNQAFAASIFQTFSCVVFATWLIVLLLIAGDIHPNPGPQSCSSESSSLSGLHPSACSDSNISILHLNIQSLLPKLDLLEVELQPFDIVLLTETWLKPSTISDDVSISNYHTVIRKDRIHRVGGGVAVYIKNMFKYTLRNDMDISGLESLVIELLFNNVNILIAVIYRPPNVSVEYWLKIEELFDRISSCNIDNVIIAGDFNCDVSIVRNNKILSIADSYGYHQLIKEKTYYTENTSSLIDLIFVKRPLTISNSQVLDPFVDGMVRFHCPIHATLTFLKPKSVVRMRRIWQYDQADYNKYRKILSEKNWANLVSGDNINGITNNLTDTILFAAESSIPNKLIRIRTLEPGWINNEIKHCIRQRKRLFQCAKRYQDNYHWAKFRQKRNEVVRLIRAAKINYFTKLSDKLKDSNTSSKAWYK